MIITSFFLLSSLGLAIIAQAQNCSKPVGGPNMNLKDEYILSNTFPDGSSVSFACSVGHTSAGGSPVITCTAGNWSSVRLRCERKNCGPTKDVPNGEVDYPEGTEFGDKAVITCNSGYRLVGKSEITCGDGQWLGRLPVCEVVVCDPPPSIGNGTFGPVKEHYEYREVVQYSCKNEFTLNGSKSLLCSDDGKFKPDPPNCVRVRCKEPEINNAEWISGARPPFGHMSIVTYQCVSGYAMNGAATLTCDINGQWSPGLPQCISKTSPTKAPSTTTTSTTTSTTTTSPPSTKRPTDTGSDLPKSLGIALGVIIGLGVIIICGCYWCGVPAFIKKKRGARKSNHDKEDAKDGEDVALS